MNDTRYGRLAAHFERAIQEGALRPGDRLPSIRDLRAQFRLSPSTIVQALVWLEDRGYIEARARSGYYVRDMGVAQPCEPTVERSALTPRLAGVKNPLVGEVIRTAADPNYLSLGTTSPPAGFYPTDRLNKWIGRIARERPHHSAGYMFPPGNPDLRRQIARRAMTFGMNVSPGDTVITSGAMEALNLAIRAVTRAGDVVAVESPTYFGILQILESLDIRVIEVPTHPRHGMDLDKLEFAIRRHKVKACVVMANCHNPLGYVLPDEAKQALLSLAVRHGIAIIEDDVYGELSYSEQRPKPIKAFDRDGIVMLCSSFSKTLAPGLRVGWIHAGRYHELVQHLQFITTIGAPSLQQAVLAGLLESGFMQRHLRSLRRQFRVQVLMMSRAIARHFPEGTRLTRPDGGYLLWVQLPNGISGQAVYRSALESKILVVPGEVCSTTGRFRDCLRLSCALPWSEKLSQGMATLGRICHELAEPKRVARAASSGRRLT
jgi:DNA-binding transcriptional MocR family regulator